MSKRLPISTVIVLILLAVLLTFQITYLAVNNIYSRKLKELSVAQNSYTKLAEVDSLARSLYVGDIDENELSDMIITGYMYGLGDKYATYMNADYFAEVTSDQNADLVGIGVLVIYNADLGAIEIAGVMPDSPALDAGIMPGDLIVKVEDENVAELGYYLAVDKMRGDEGSVARFTVMRGDDESGYDELEFSIIRAHVVEQTVMYHRYVDATGSNTDTGIIKILQFDAKTPQQFKDAVNELSAQGVKKLIFDVRYNPGGELNSITEILDFLLPEGPILRIYDREGNEEVEYSNAAAVDMPMAVLINGNTASAAELFSSALQDYKKAILVGTVTYGKGTMQSVIPLDDGSAISISTQMYNPPYSDNYEDIGVQPDVEVELSEALAEKNIYKISDHEDNQLQAALRALAGEVKAQAETAAE